LTALAHDPASADAVLALADMRHAGDSDWPKALINSLVAARQYARARSVWAAAAHVELPATLSIYDSAFADQRPGPPFNWELISSTVGLAERQPGGRLHVIYYGHEDGVLARELILLSPGTYRLTMALAGDGSHAGAMNWSLRCDRSPTPFASTRLDAVAAHEWIIAVPANCPAQWLELSGSSADISQQSEVTIGNFKLVPVQPRG
jgi:hypothetical protein